jgi:hypothetical protein
VSPAVAKTARERPPLEGAGPVMSDDGELGRMMGWPTTSCRDSERLKYGMSLDVP